MLDTDDDRESRLPDWSRELGAGFAAIADAIVAAVRRIERGDYCGGKPLSPKFAGKGSQQWERRRAWRSCRREVTQVRMQRLPRGER